MRALMSVYFEDAATLHSVNQHRVPPPSSWHSPPVPYLFGTLAVILGLIAFSLLILACSFGCLSSSSDEEDGRNVGGVDEDKEIRSGNEAANGTYEEKFVVIMAGEDLPRFLATPTPKICTCGDNEGKRVHSQEDSVGKEEEKIGEEGEEEVKDAGETTTSHV